ncbi:MAG TPA: SDR family oxidoreductase [Longimicrobium sp.]|nr:SDR family oxidoreductase [Longimicrobium sp.]
MGEMTGRVCVVTGASGGIGRATAVELARRGATVALVIRSREKGQAVLAQIERDTGRRDARLVLADLSRRAEVRRAAGEIVAAHPRIDVLVNNAAVYTRRRTLTDDGIEMQWAVNHLAPFLLTHLLLPVLVESAPARVVTVSSNAHQSGEMRWDDLEMKNRRYLGFRQYANTKLANVLFTRELARRTAGTGVTANALHPGVVATPLLLNGFPPIRLFRRWMRTPEQGAATSVHLATSSAVAGVTGQYFQDERPVPLTTKLATDDEAARRLWEISARAVGVE